MFAVTLAGRLEGGGSSELVTLIAAKVRPLYQIHIDRPTGLIGAGIILWKLQVAELKGSTNLRTHTFENKKNNSFSQPLLSL